MVGDPVGRGASALTRRPLFTAPRSHGGTAIGDLAPERSNHAGHDLILKDHRSSRPAGHPSRSRNGHYLSRRARRDARPACGRPTGVAPATRWVSRPCGHYRRAAGLDRKRDCYPVAPHRSLSGSVARDDSCRARHPAARGRPLGRQDQDDPSNRRGLPVGEPSSRPARIAALRRSRRAVDLGVWDRTMDRGGLPPLLPRRCRCAAGRRSRFTGGSSVPLRPPQ